MDKALARLKDMQKFGGFPKLSKLYLKAHLFKGSKDRQHVQFLQGYYDEHCKGKSYKESRDEVFKMIEAIVGV